MKSKLTMFLSLITSLIILFTFVGCNVESGNSSSGGGSFSDSSTDGGKDSSGTPGGESEAFKYSEYLISHAENANATYVFEAECTDLGNKSGPAWSGSYTESAMITTAEGASGGYALQGLGQTGNSVNFLVVCDRDVDDARLVLQLGNTTKYEMVLDSSKYFVRIDTIVSDEDLLPVSDGGAIGNWDKFFLNYYTDLNETGAYYISPWKCGEIRFEAPSAFTAGNVYMGASDGYTITETLRLKKGVNCVSLITANDEVMVGTTMTATAPAVDCIEITTTAQLGMYYKNDNGGYGVTACKIK